MTAKVTSITWPLICVKPESLLSSQHWTYICDWTPPTGPDPNHHDHHPWHPAPHSPIAFMKGSKFSCLCSWYLPEKLMVAMRFPPQLVSSSASEAVHCGLIYRRLFPLWMLAIGLHLSPPLWPGSNINLRAMVNDKKKMGTAEICPNSANINSVNQVPTPVVLQPLRGYSPMKCACTYAYVYTSMHIRLSVRI